jgi:hypothetical protein
MLDEETFKRRQRDYTGAVEFADEILVDVLCAAFQRMTGTKCSDRLEDDIRQALRSR